MSKVTELLTNYLSYKYAVSVYERHKPMPSAGIANYNGMPSGEGAPERFFDMVGKPADFGNASWEDEQDYLEYKSTVMEIEGALSILTDIQYHIIYSKWMKGLTLKQIAENGYMGLTGVKAHHRRAMRQLENAFRFTECPEIVIHVYSA